MIGTGRITAVAIAGLPEIWQPPCRPAHRRDPSETLLIVGPDRRFKTCSTGFSSGALDGSKIAELDRRMPSHPIEQRDGVGARGDMPRDVRPIAFASHHGFMECPALLLARYFRRDIDGGEDRADCGAWYRPWQEYL